MRTTSLVLLGAAAPLALGADVVSLPATPAAPAINRGKEFHHLWVARLEQGKTADDLLEALRDPGPLPVWVRDAGGPGAPAPGGESNATVSLLPGTYVLACLIPSDDGISHLMKGMIRKVAVVETERPADVPVGDVAMTLHDYSFTLSDPLRAGTRIIEVRNEAAQDHEIELIRLAPGRTAQDVLAWLKDEEGPPPGVPLGGVAPLEPRGVSWFQPDLEPGRYMLICFVPDEKSCRAHFTHGMLREIDVGSAVSSRE
jgi:hypothetical protein